METQYKNFANMIETKLDAYQNEIFSYKEENTALKKRIDILEREKDQKLEREKFLTSQIREAQVTINKQAQRQYSNDVIIITEAENTPTHLPQSECKSSTAKKNKEGKFIRTVKFTSLDSKISFLAKRRTFNFLVLPSLCPELRLLHNETKKLVENGTIKKTYIYKDQIMCILKDDSKFCCMSFMDLTVLRAM